MPTLPELVREHRAAIIDREKAAIADMQQSFEDLWPRVRVELDKLTAKMQERIQAGGKIPESWLLEQGRLQSVLDATEGMLIAFADHSFNITHEAQITAIRAGASNAQTLLGATVPDGVSWQFGQVPFRVISTQLGMFQSSGPLAKSLNAIVPEAVKAVRTDIILGTSMGKNPRDIARDVVKTLQVPYSQALVISRSTVLNSYRYASQQQYEANSDILTGYVRKCSLSARTCIACLALDGTEYKTDELMEVHPADRCVMIPLTRPWSEILSGVPGIDTSSIPDTRPSLGQTGEEWFAKQPVATQQKILGPGRLALYQQGTKFQSFATTGHTEWGPSLQVTTLQQLKKGA